MGGNEGAHQLSQPQQIDSADGPHPRDLIPFTDKVYYGIGQYGEGPQSSAALSLLLFYYNQVVGLNAALIGISLMITALLNAAPAGTIVEKRQ